MHTYCGYSSLSIMFQLIGRAISSCFVDTEEYFIFSNNITVTPTTAPFSDTFKRALLSLKWVQPVPYRTVYKNNNKNNNNNNDKNIIMMIIIQGVVNSDHKCN